jgi:hypothetical protein
MSDWKTEIKTKAPVVDYHLELEASRAATEVVKALANSGEFSHDPDAGAKLGNQWADLYRAAVGGMAGEDKADD